MAANTAPTFIVSPGQATTDFGGVDRASVIAVQADGKIVAVGNTGGSTLAITRYLSDGSLDTTLNGTGKATATLASTVDSPFSVSVQADGKILVVGRIQVAGLYDFAVVRFNADGSLDTAYGTGGRTSVGTAPNNDFANGSLVQTDGKLVTVGGSGSISVLDAAVLRLGTTGSPDTGFGGTGFVVTDLGGTTESFLSLAQQTDGKLVAVGTAYVGSNTFVATVRYNTDGSLDTSFNGTGKVLTNAAANAASVAVQVDGKIVSAGSNSSDIVVLRYNADGSVDTSFNGTGKVITDASGATDTVARVHAQADGKILVIGKAGNTDAFIVRYNSDGTLDTGFNGTGKMVTAFGGSIADYASSVAVQADGKILVGGARAAGDDFAVTRYNADGSPDLTFGPAVNTLNNSISYTENSSGIVLSPLAGISDAELTASGYADATLALARNGGANAQDVFGATGNLSFAGGNVTLSGTVIGTIAQAAGTATLTFNASATQARLNEALKLITYSNSSDAPPAAVQVNWTFNDGNTGTQGTGGALAATGSTTVNITATNDNPTGTVTISGTATQGQVLTAANTLADLDGIGTISYQWLRAGVVIVGATGSTYTLVQADVTRAISVRASYTDAGGRAETSTSSATASIANANDAPTGAVTISGTVTQGQTLTAANTLADLDGLGAITYQWLRDGVAIGATGSTYTLVQADVAKVISVRASYTDGFGFAETPVSAGTAAVANVNDPLTGGVTLSGTATQGQTLTAADTLADADGLGAIGYQWLRAGVNIGGATAGTYTLTQADVGLAVSVRATYTDGGATVESATSGATAAVANVNDLPTGSVTVAGTATQGQVLTAGNTLADADGLGVVSYQWLRAGVNIGGATAGTYTLTQADVGQAISVRAGYTDTLGAAETVTSSATAVVANVNDLPTGTVSLTGTATQNQTLTAANTLADVDGLGTIGYQWLRGGVNIGGATASTYALTQADVGALISVRASYTDTLGAAEAVTSGATTAVANVNDAPTGSVTITGSSVEGSVLTAANTLADLDGLGTLGFQWLRDGVNIGAATAGTYTLAAADVGHAVKVRISYTDGGGTAEAVDATPLTVTAAPAPAPAAPPPLVVAPGTAGVDDTVTLSGNRSQYTITRDAEGHYSLKRAGDTTAVSLQSIEHLKFGDKSVNLTVGDAARSITTAQLDSLIELYVAYVNRVPDADGMVFWINQFKAGQTLEQIGQSFYSASVQYGSLTGYSATMSNEAFVSLVYKNALGRSDPDAQGLAFWSSALASGAATRGTVVATMLGSAHTFKGDATYGYVASLLDNKITVGKEFAVHQGLVYNTPQESISIGMEINALVSPVSTTAAITLIGVPEGSHL